MDCPTLGAWLQVGLPYCSPAPPTSSALIEWDHVGDALVGDALQIDHITGSVVFVLKRTVMDIH